MVTAVSGTSFEIKEYSPDRVNKIFESHQMADILGPVEGSKKTKYVLIDVDNTLIAPVQMIGSAQWRAYIRKKAAGEGFTPKEADEVLDKLWYHVQPLIEVRLVDVKAREVIERMKDELKIPVLAFTARDFDETAHTEKQLSDVKIDLFNSHFEKEIWLPLPHKGLYKNGVIYCGENSKGDTMLAFFLATHKIPEEVHNIDDKREQLENGKKASEEKKIAYTGMHLRTEDERVKSFNGRIADLQLEMLPKLISDEEAQLILDQNSDRPQLKLRDFLARI